MANGARVTKVLWAFVFSSVTFAGACLLIGRLYVGAAEVACGDATACPCQPGISLWPNGFFYAAQTITTTGYGTGVAVHLGGVQSLSVFVMPLAALYWGVVVAAIYDAIKKQ